MEFEIECHKRKLSKVRKGCLFTIEDEVYMKTARTVEGYNAVKLIDGTISKFEDESIYVKIPRVVRTMQIDI